MSNSIGIDVEECEKSVVLMDNVCRNLLVDDFSKDSHNLTKRIVSFGLFNTFTMFKNTIHPQSAMGLLVGMINVIWITVLPFLELRASIPYGLIFYGEFWLLVVVLAMLTNIALAAVLYLIVDWLVETGLKVPLLSKIYHRSIERIHKKAHGYVHIYGTIGLGLFIGIPLPGSGVYSGVLAAKILGMSYKDFMIASVIGVVLAGTVVTLIMMSGLTALSWMVKGWGA